MKMLSFFALPFLLLASLAFAAKEDTRGSGASNANSNYNDTLNSAKSAPNRNKAVSAHPLNEASPARNSGQITAQEDEQERMETRHRRKKIRQEQQMNEDLGNGSTTNTKTRE